MEYDVDLLTLLERVRSIRSFDAVTLVKKIQQNWDEGITPSRSELRKLHEFIKVDGPCERLTESGQCNGWLRKNVELFDIPINAPYTCPFNEKQNWNECYGFRKIK
jgi:hypothetical protein